MDSEMPKAAVVALMLDRHAATMCVEDADDVADARPTCP